MISYLVLFVIIEMYEFKFDLFTRSTVDCRVPIKFNNCVKHNLRKLYLFLLIFRNFKTNFFELDYKSNT